MSKQFMRSLTKSFYDCQQLRIEIGNRICQNVRIKLGQTPGTKTEEMDIDAQKLLKSLTDDYKRLSDALTSSTNRAKAKLIKDHPGVITDQFEFELVGCYVDMLEKESILEKNIANMLKAFPIYTAFLQQVRGCGPLMSAVIISELDPHKANSISAFWKYAGLDVVVNEDGTTEGRSKKAHHLVEQTYLDKDGKEQIKKGITFNPFLKTKLVGVLGSSFIKLRSPYRDLYDGQKQRLECDPRTAELTKLHKHNRAVRFMIKIFLKELWLKWRELEGLEIRPDYAEEKLGIKHHKKSPA
ncbi:transposase [Sporomusa aerivorans]|uniref:transposase n=1 Tax=Sporomusa aerivorans TaxID=204936 RepID=UPI00352B61AC